MIHFHAHVVADLVHCYFHFLARTLAALRIILIFFNNFKQVTAPYPKLDQCYFLFTYFQYFFIINLPFNDI